VGEALASLQRQTFRDFEVVAVDDGSTDRSRDILDAHGWVRTVGFPENRGVVQAAMRGVDEAGGKLVARMDADDVCHEERLEKQVEFLDAHLECGACVTGVRVTGEEVKDGFRRFEDWVNGLGTPEAIARERFIDQPVVNPSAMLRREIVEMFPLRDMGWAEDYDFWLRLVGAGVRVGKLSEVMLEWRDSPQRLTRTGDPYSPEAFSRAKAHFLAKLSDRFAVCGAGPIGKRMARHLREKGAQVEVFYEVNPRRIGERIAGVEVRSQEHLATACGGGVVLLAAVGRPGARNLIRGQARAAGYVEGEDFFCVA